MKNIFVDLKKKWLFISLAVVLIIPLLWGLFYAKRTSIPKPEYTIVIDAGHGGRDVK